MKGVVTFWNLGCGACTHLENSPKTGYSLVWLNDRGEGAVVKDIRPVNEARHTYEWHSGTYFKKVYAAKAFYDEKTQDDESRDPSMFDTPDDAEYDDTDDCDDNSGAHYDGMTCPNCDDGELIYSLKTKKYHCADCGYSEER